MKVNALVSGLTVVAILTSGCASIMQGTSQTVGISSSPSSATVTVNGMERGKTPVNVDLKRKDNHVVRIELVGYAPFEATFTRKTSGWVWGNILFGGLIGLVVDAVSGGMYKLTPEQIQAELKQNNATALYQKDQLLIAVVLKADPAWEKIGNLNAQ